MSVLPTAGGPSSAGRGLPRGLDVLDATVRAGRLNPPVAGVLEVPRPRLQDALTAAVVATPLTVVTGPTGSGKTVLTAAWARSHIADPVAWLSLGPTAAEAPRAFWAGVVHALNRAGILLDTPAHRPQLPTGFTVRLAAQLAALPRPAVLVIDHADALTRPDILEPLELLAGAVPSQLRLVLLARADPLLPLARERAAGRLAEIRAADLAFRPHEVRETLGRLGTPVTAADAAALAAATGGCAVTLPLVAALLRHGVPPVELAAAIADDDGAPAQYLLGQVLARLPPSMRGVLLRGAVAAELWPGLVTAVTDRRDGLRLLDWLAAGSTCVERTAGGPGGLRIPSLIRELLVAELAVADPAAHAAAHRAAADWYAAAERLPEAVAHAVAAGDWAGVATLLVDDLAIAALLARCGPPEADLLDAVRPQLRGADAALLRAAATLARTGTAEPADLALALAVAAGGQRPTARASATLLLSAADIGARAHPDRALAAIDAAHGQVGVLTSVRPERRAECDAVLATERASALLATDTAEPTLIEAVSAAEVACAAAGAERLRAGRLADLALLQALAGRLVQAEALAADYQALCESFDVPRATRSPASATAAAWVAAERGQVAEARRWAARAAEGSGHRRAVFAVPLLAVLDSRRHRLRGQLDAAGQALAGAPAGDRLPRWVCEQLVAEEVWLRLARGDDGALRPLDALPGTSPRTSLLRAAAAAHGMATGPVAVPEIAGTGVLPVVAIETQLVRAELLAAHGHTDAAAAVLDVALHAAEPDGLRRPFLDAPPAARRLIRTHPRLAAASGWLFSTESRSARPSSQPGTAPLSDREREALALVAAGLSTAGIAAAMGTSNNTTRGHLRSILRKLSAADRADAVRRAAHQQPPGAAGP